MRTGTERPGQPIGRAEMELRLEIFLSIREPGRRYSHAQIAAACGCSRTLIWQIERRALAKLRRAARGQNNPILPQTGR